MEAWSSSTVARHRQDGINIEKTYSDGGHGALFVTAIPNADISAGIAFERVATEHVEKRDCLDNALMESFFGVLKTEFFHRKIFTSVESFVQELSVFGITTTIGSS